ncbi:MAG TPA: carotenoid oxygenase family protein, partial [Microthrixaceae bacterium]|nr:carotenoid oxygenase family protein [Microthrixaceae bacterium]
VEVLDLGAGAGQNEAVFVPASPDADEDDGWVLCLTYGADTDTSRLEIRHAQALTDGPVATVHLPVRVPFGFHGNWIPDA